MFRISCVYFVVGLVGFLSSGTGGSEPPVVEIVAWMETDDYRWKSGNEMEIQGVVHNKTTFIIPGDIHGVVISCNATYPVEWEFSPDENVDPSRMVFSIYTMPRREGMEQNKMLFSMKLFLYGDTNAFTGKYICKQVGGSDRNSFYGSLQTSVYLFWEGNSPPYLMGSGKTITVSSYQKTSVRLPCPVSFPEVDVFLQRKMNITNVTIITNVTVVGNATVKRNVTVKNTETKIVDLEFSTNTTGMAPIIYDPTVGFIVDNPMVKNSSIDGEYKCMTAEKDDVVTVVVTPDKLPNPDDNHAGKYKLDKGARLFYNETSQQFVCCSNTDKPPSVFIFYCISYAHCRLATPLIYHNMVAKFYHQYASGGAKENCASTYVYQGAYRCSGDGVDVTKIVFSTWYYFNGTYKRDIYWSWQEITSERQKRLVSLSLQVVPKPGGSVFPSSWYYYQTGMAPSPVLYTGQNISFSCQPAMFYYADGVAWKILWKNHTTTFPKNANEGYDARYWFYSPPKSTYVTINTQIHSVICLAPIWNSTEWVEKEFVVIAKDPIPPQVTSPNDQDLYWTLNATKVSIRCDATGDPAPRLQWTKNGKEVHGGNGNVQVEQVNSTTTITFMVAEYNVHGTYACVAENLVNRAQKEFNVYIEEAHPWVATVVITCIVLVFLTVIGLLCWRVKVNHDTASELRWRTS